MNKCAKILLLLGFILFIAGAWYVLSGTPLGGGFMTWEQVEARNRWIKYKGLIAEISPHLGTTIVGGIVLQVMLSAGEGNVRSPDVPLAVIAILQSLGVPRRQAHAVVKRVTSTKSNS